MRLNATNVHDLYEKCLINQGNMAESVVVEGIVSKSFFHRGRLEEHKSEIMEMLMELPHQFRQSDGGGWTFLNGCINDKGQQWGEQPTVDRLFQLGIGTGQAAYMMPREMWSVFPGGVPYCIVKDGAKETA